MAVTYPCCEHCRHDVPWGGRDTLIPGQKAHTEPCKACEFKLEWQKK